MASGTPWSKASRQEVGGRGLLCVVIFACLLAMALAAAPGAWAADKHRAASRAAAAAPPPEAQADPLAQPCQPPEELRTSALCAQWKAADAARDGANGVGWLFVALLLAVCLAFAAAVAAVLALREGRKTAGMLAKAFESGRAVILPCRAFVTAQVTPQMFGEPDYSLVEAGLDWRNFGERTALHVQARQALLVQPRDVGAPLTVPGGLEAAWLSLAAGEEVEGRVEALPQGQVAAVARGQMDLYLVGEVTFRDQLDPERVRHEQYVMRADFVETGEAPAPGGSLVGLQLTQVETAAGVKRPSVRGAIEGWILDRKASEIRSMLSKLDGTSPVGDLEDGARR